MNIHSITDMYITIVNKTDRAIFRRKSNNLKDFHIELLLNKR